MAKGIKISDLSKDFSMKSKDIIEEFKTVDIEKTTGGTVSDEEFAVFMQHITSTHQISDLEAYTTGKITIKIADKTEKKAAPKAEEKKPEVNYNTEEDKSDNILKAEIRIEIVQYVALNDMPYHIDRIEGERTECRIHISYLY